jgi:hypothetical protein
LAAALTALTALQSVDFRCAAGSAVALARWPADLSLARDGGEGKGCYRVPAWGIRRQNKRRETRGVAVDVRHCAEHLKGPVRKERSPSHWQQRVDHANGAEKALSSLRAQHGILHSVGGSPQREVGSTRWLCRQEPGRVNGHASSFRLTSNPAVSSNQIGGGISSLAASFTALTALQWINLRCAPEPEKGGGDGASCRGGGGGGAAKCAGAALQGVLMLFEPIYAQAAALGNSIAARMGKRGSRRGKIHVEKRGPGPSRGGAGEGRVSPSTSISHGSVTQTDPSMGGRAPCS